MSGLFADLTAEYPTQGDAAVWLTCPRCHEEPKGYDPVTLRVAADGVPVCSAGCGCDEAAIREMCALPERRDDATVENPGGRHLFFETAAALRHRIPEEYDFICEPFLVAEAVTVFSGQEKSGKSTFAFALAEAVAEAPQFLGGRIRNGPVVVVTEEGNATIRDRLPDSERVFVSTRDSQAKPEWATAINDARVKAAEVGAVLLVIDTLPFWWDPARGEENDTGAAQRALRGVFKAARDGLAVLLTAHGTKDGREGPRGAGAIGGIADMLAHYSATGANRRAIKLRGRWTVPERMNVSWERTTNSWAYRVEEGEALPAGAEPGGDLEARVLAAVAAEPLTRTEIVKAVQGRKTDVLAAINSLIEGGSRSGSLVEAPGNRWEPVPALPDESFPTPVPGTAGTAGRRGSLGRWFPPPGHVVGGGTDRTPEPSGPPGSPPVPFVRGATA